MTHIQQLFIQNLRYYRTQAGISQLDFSEKIGLSHNYLNAVENGKNFPSPEVLQKIADELGILPYQLFLEDPNFQDTSKSDLIQLTRDLKQKIIKDFDEFIEESKA